MSDGEVTRQVLTLIDCTVYTGRLCMSTLGVWLNFQLWRCSIKSWVDHSTVCGVCCPIKLWFDHSIVCGVGCPINSDVKSDVIVAVVKARRMEKVRLGEKLSKRFWCTVL